MVQYGAYRAALTAQTVESGGGMLALANPEGQTLIITNCVLYVVTETPAGEYSRMVIKAGIGATPTAANDDLLSGAPLHIAGYTTNNAESGNAYTAKWDADEYLVAAASPTGDEPVWAPLTGFSGYLYIEYFRTE